MSDKQKKGIFYDAAQTVEDMRKLISWFRMQITLLLMRSSDLRWMQTGGGLMPV